jgi:hypothetical protein
MDQSTWHTFPCIRNRKEPAVPDWENAARPGYGTTEQASGSYGIACGPSGLVVVDCDVDKVTGEYTGLVNFLALCADHGYFPETFQVTTPSGGTHFYFTACPDHEVRNRAKRITLDGRTRPLDGVDVRGAGGYVLGPDSLGRGRRYEITRASPAALLPEWLCTALRRPESRDLSGRTYQPDASGPGPLPSALRAGHGYGEQALHNEIQCLLLTREGRRNVQLNESAFNLGQLVASQILPGARVIDALEQAAHRIGLEPREIRRTIMNGLRAGMSADPRTRSMIK